MKHGFSPEHFVQSSPNTLTYVLTSDTQTKKKAPLTIPKCILSTIEHDSKIDPTAQAQSTFSKLEPLKKHRPPVSIAVG